MPALGYQLLALLDAATPCLYYQCILVFFPACAAWIRYICGGVGLHVHVFSMHVN